jgi:adenylate cyclase class IV
MKELWLKADDLDKAVEFFENIWFKKIRKNIKKRVSYLIKWVNWASDIQFDFDKYLDLDWKEIPEFLELESDNIDIIYEYAEKLWIKKDELLDWNAKKLSEYYWN